MSDVSGPAAKSALARAFSRLGGRSHAALPDGTATQGDLGDNVREFGDGQLLQLLESSACGLLGCRADGTVALCSPMAGRLLGAAPQDVLGRPVAAWLASEDRGPVAELLAAGRREVPLRRANGSVFLVEWTVGDPPATPDGLRLLLLRDITERRRAQERLSQLANFDSLTGLPNRALFRDRLSRAMERAHRTGTAMALMFLDLDNFKLVNDSLGHEAGDHLLRHVAATLRGCLRVSDRLEARPAEEPHTVARLGGDEFTVILQDVPGPDDVAVVARRILDALETPLLIGGKKLQVSASLGISMYPGEDVDLDGLVRHTDMAMYRSKLRGRGTYSFYSAEMSAEVAARVSLESDLRRALERGEFVLHYQPKADLASGEITGVEALIRWHPPGRGLVPPDRFITVLEDSGLILPVGAWAIRAACADLAAWDRAGLPPLLMAVNLSARQFRQPNLARMILDTLQDAGLDGHRLEVELTEGLLLEDDQMTRDALATLAGMGVRVAMDDFGMGHSSMSQLKRLDIDTLKIDRSFVSELPHDAEDAAIASAIVAMGRTLQMKVVAEGVETAAQARFLESVGCDEIQGYLLSRPLAAGEFVRWFETRLNAARKRQLPREYTETSPMTLMSLETLDGLD
jgi:diguanylate cyclase (GGDEF)-like protein/PAS domain S-box-containing protein